MPSHKNVLQASCKKISTFIYVKEGITLLIKSFQQRFFKNFQIVVQ